MEMPPEGSFISKPCKVNEKNDCWIDVFEKEGVKKSHGNEKNSNQMPCLFLFLIIF